MMPIDCFEVAIARVLTKADRAVDNRRIVYVVAFRYIFGFSRFNRSVLVIIRDPDRSHQFSKSEKTLQTLTIALT